MNNLICKINVCNIINQTSNPILIVLNNMIAHQLIDNNINNNHINSNITISSSSSSNNNYNIKNSNSNAIQQPLLTCDCLIIHNNKSLPHYQAYWKHFIQSQSQSTATIKTTSNNTKFGGCVLLPRFVHVNTTASFSSLSKEEEIVSRNFPELFKSRIQSEKKSASGEIDIIDSFAKNKELCESNVFFLELQNLDNLLHRLIRYRYLKHSNDNDIDILTKNNPIWSKYQKWFKMGIVEWIECLDDASNEQDKKKWYMPKQKRQKSHTRRNKKRIFTSNRDDT